MPAPVSIAHVHVHALRLASGAEALVARVLTADGVAGFGFSLGTEAFPARDMAAWDAAARSRRLPLYALFGRKQRKRVAVEREDPTGAQRLDPFGLGSLEAARSLAGTKEGLALLAPNAHLWEISYCAALAGILPGNVRIAVPEQTALGTISVSDVPGIDIDWSLESGFAALKWYPSG
jgi:L-alanine-DL-glutamate epimerase-like enolase superfamily enzyme